MTPPPEQPKSEKCCGRTCFSPDDERDSACPICLHPYKDAKDDGHRQVYGLCRHSFCLDCLERLLTTPLRSSSESSTSTTLGSCPLCRADLSLFDIKHKEEWIYPPHSPQWLLDHTGIPRGSVYGSVGGSEELPRLQFSSDGGSISVRFHNLVQANGSGSGTNNNEKERRAEDPEQKGDIAITEIRYHAPTQTLAMRSASGKDGRAEFEIVLTFSYDWQFVPRGYIQDTRAERRFLGGYSGRIYRLLESDDRRSSRERNVSVAWTPTYHADTLFGNTFCQGLTVGLASYHFQSLEDSYISYENPATAQWPPLDNGMPIPSRVPFRNASYSASDDSCATTTFCGDICWLHDFGTAWQGSIRWEYEIKFDSEFLCIVGGGVRSISLNPGGTDEVSQDMSTYGETLIYMNAALFDHFRLMEGDARPRMNDLQERLEREGASVRCIAPVQQILRRSQLPGVGNPFDFNNTAEATL